MIERGIGPDPGRTKPEITHVLFDFFGTLVDYSPSRTEQGYHASHALLQSLGAEIGYDEYLAGWSATAARFDARSDIDDSEFSMAELGGAVLAALLARDPTGPEVRELVETHLAEWNTGVTYPAATTHVVETMGRRFRLAVVTNTNETDLVPNHLVAMGIADRFDAVVTSVEVGWRKPHPEIYTAALRSLGAAPSASVFIGDDYTADFVGAQAVGMTAYLIDPHRHHDVPDDQRLDTLAELPARLGLLSH